MFAATESSEAAERTTIFGVAVLPEVASNNSPALHETAPASECG
jgi:hypothetical protein